MDHGRDNRTAICANQEQETDCFYDQCNKKTYCNDYIVCGKFKSKSHGLFCSILILLCTTLFLCITAPLIVFKLVDVMVDEEVVIDSEDASNYESWQTNAQGSGAKDLDIHYDLYFFNVQNPEGVTNGEKPILVEMGPYAFQEYFYKFDIEWTDDGDTVTYNNYKYYIFNPERTGPGLSINDNLTLPYVTILAFEYYFSLIPPEATEYLDAELKAGIRALDANFTALIETAYERVDNAPLIPRIKNPLEAEIKSTNQSIQDLFDDLYRFVDQSDPADLLLKTLLCEIPDGLTPFITLNPVNAWFGWLTDPLLKQVEKLLNNYNLDIPWTNSIPGASINYTSIDDTRRRRGKDTYKTGKKNPNQFSQMVKYQNMTSFWACVNAMGSQDPDEYEEGKDFPACEHFQTEWSPQTATEKGYQQPFATPYANRIEGTDANMFGRPLRSEKIQVFISDIYRSAYLEHFESVQWRNDIPLWRYGIQFKDLENATVNPTNAQYYNFAPSGMENGTLAANAPVFVSFPHFLYGDPALVSAVTGLNPQEEIHQCYLDVEPQTGLLVGAHKRLQLIYEMKSVHLPETAPDSISEANNICGNLSSLVDTLIQLGIGDNLTPLSCNLTSIEPLLTCYNQPSKWDYRNDRIFMPYGWADESFYLPDDDADDLSATLLFIENLANQFQLWSLITSGILFGILCIMIINSHYMYTHFKDKYPGFKHPHTDNIWVSVDETGNNPSTQPLLHHMDTPPWEGGPSNPPFNPELYRQWLEEQQRNNNNVVESPKGQVVQRTGSFSFADIH